MRLLKKYCFILVAVVLYFSFSSLAFADSETELSVSNTLSDSGVSKIKVSPDGSILLATGMPYSYLWNVNSGISKKIEVLTNENVYDAAFSPDGKRFIVSAGVMSRQVLLFDSNSGELLDTIRLKYDDQQADSLSFTSDSKAIIVGVRGSVKIINLESKAELLKFDTVDYVSVIKHNPQNDEFSMLTPQGALQIRNEKTGEIIKSLSAVTINSSGSTRFYDLAYSQDGNYFVVSHNDGSTSESIVFNAKNNYEQSATLSDSGSISFSKDSKLLIIGNKVFPIENNFRQSYDIKVKNSNDVLNPFNTALTPDGKYFLYTNHDGINVLDAATLSVRLVSLEIEPKNLAMSVNEHVDLKMSGVYSDGTKKTLASDKIKWNIQDFSVADMKDSALFGRSNGLTTLTASYGGLNATTSVVIADTPTNLHASLSKKNVNLQWSAVKNTNDLMGYNLYRRAANGSYDKTPVTDFPITTMEYIDATIMNDQDYYYIIKALYKGQFESQPSSEVFVTSKVKQIILQVDNPYMTVNGEQKEVDEGKGTKPIVANGRTLLPIRALIEELGGKLDWSGEEQKITLLLNDSKIELWIDKNKAVVNGNEKILDVPPTIINERTMLPLRFVADNLGLILDWEASTHTITISYGSKSNLSNDSIRTKWYEQEYTQPVSDQFGKIYGSVKYIDSGIGFTINYPLSWGKPKITESEKHSYGTYTTFYKSDNTQIISYGDTLKQNESYEAYLTRNGIDKINIVSEGKMQNSDKVYYINTESGNTRKVIIMIFKQSEVCVLETTIIDVNLIEKDKTALDLITETIKTLEINPAVG